MAAVAGDFADVEVKGDTCIIGTNTRTGVFWFSHLLP